MTMVIKSHRNVGIMSICILREDQGKPKGQKEYFANRHSANPGKKRRALSLHCKPFQSLVHLCEYFSLMH